MASIELLVAFALATAVFAFVPGPAMVYAAARTLAGGRRAGLMAALGIHIGGYLHVAAAAAGLSVLLDAVPGLYAAVKLAGAAYLVWLGLMLLRAPRTESPPGAGVKSGRRAFLESVAVEALNPKTAFFFLAFLPQFIDPAAALPAWLQFLVLGTIVNGMFTLADLVCVAFADAVVSGLRRSTRAQCLVRLASGAVLVALGVRLALQRA